MAQVLDTLYVDIITRNFGQVSQQIRGVTAQLRQAHTGAQMLERSAGGSSATMANLGRAATASGAGMAVFGVAAAGVGVALAAAAAGLALVKQGFADTTELYRFNHAFQQVARDAAGLFVPVMNQATRSMWAMLDTFRNSPAFQDAIAVGLVAPMILFVKGLEVAIRLTVALGDAVARMTAGMLKLAGVNIGGAGLFGRLIEAVRKSNKQVTLDQTGEESGQQTFQRIQQAILKLSEPDEKDPVAEVLKEIDGKMDEIVRAINNFGRVAENNPAAVAGIAMQPLDVAVFQAQNMANAAANGALGLLGRLGVR